MADRKTEDPQDSAGNKLLGKDKASSYGTYLMPKFAEIGFGLFAIAQTRPRGELINFKTPRAPLTDATYL